MTSSRKTIPYGVGSETAPPRSENRRRRASLAEMVPPHVSPLPARLEPGSVDAAEGGKPAVGSVDARAAEDPAAVATAVTQPMPVIVPARPAIPPPPRADPGEPAPRSERAAKRPKSDSPGVYRFAAPPSERRKKR